MTDEPEQIPGVDEIREGDRPCPQCGRRMDVQVRKGTKIDVCPDHGIWLDKGELDEILAAVRGSVRRNQRAAVRRARKDGKVSGALFGWWALLGD